MTDPKNLSIGDFDYPLPAERIAKFPLAERDQSKLLIFDNGKISSSIYRRLSEHIPSDSLLVFNDTKVLSARVIFRKETGGEIEIFCLQPDKRYQNVSVAMKEHAEVYWECMIGGASKWKRGQVLSKVIRIGGRPVSLTAHFIAKRPGDFLIRFSWDDQSISFEAILDAAGEIPLPPYLQRTPESSDSDRYQTIYAKPPGSVAAPTAGLHFTDAIFDELRRKGITTAFTTLHVGAGTFQPVKSADVGGHSMHGETVSIPLQTVRLLKQHAGNIIAVGTTSLRAIESLYWLGLKLMAASAMKTSAELALSVDQWEPYDTGAPEAPVNEVLDAVIAFCEANGAQSLNFDTRILIAPPYRARIVSGLITNFHQPRSTLLLLVAALIGDDWKKVYRYALENDFRFLSYGDGCLLWLTPGPEEDSRPADAGSS
ncbi:MAG TPA: S-adenosylmethionine:tRNA ribosyltransferase-isomerase [Chitinophagaceae bacterium]